MVESIQDDPEHTRVMLGLLNSVGKDGGQSQRRLASELGIALGLVNAYLKRCIKKGLVKASQAPARRYVYYLTPQGFAEKSRLTAEYLRYSFDFFRHAKADCLVLYQNARSRGLDRIALAGKSELAEVAVICALESGIQIIAVVDPEVAGETFMSFPLVREFDAIAEEPHAVVITDMRMPRETRERAVACFGASRVLVPELLNMHLSGVAAE